jgi:hypothetical protein
MRVPGSMNLLVMALAMAACSNESTRPGPRVTQNYVLESLDGRSLPTIFESDDVTLTALSGTLALDSTGSSTSITHVNQVPDNFGPNEYDTVARGEYRFRGDSIEIGSFSKCQDLCVPNRLGVVSDSSLTLEYFTFMGTGPHIFLYRLVAAQP